jgi:hypothetical protein
MSPETPPRRRRPRRSFLRLLLGLPLLAIAAACDTDNTAPAPAGTPSRAPEPVAPRGATALPFMFTWKAVPGGDWIYRVIVTDAAERVLMQYDVRHATACPPTTDVKNMLAGHTAFNWSVAVVTPDGRFLARSAPVPFFVK